MVHKARAGKSDILRVMNRVWLSPRILGLLAPLLLVLGVLVAGCNVINSATEETGATPAPSPTSAAVVTVAPPPVIVPTTPPLTVTAPLSVLRVWLPGEIGMRTESGAAVLANQIREFNTRYPELEIVIEQKPVDGQGGILSYLRTGRNVAPGTLPDLIALPARAVPAAANDQLIFAIDGFVEPAVLETLYPVSSGQVLRDGSLYGLPFAETGLSHLVYPTRVVTDGVPLLWNDFISGTARTLLLPADSPEGAMLGLQFYLAEGGTLVNEAGQPDLQIEPLTRALEAIGAGKPNLLQSQQLRTLEESWQLYLNGTSNHVWMRSDFLQAQPPEGEGALPAAQLERGFAPVPGPAGPLTPLVNTWVWAVSADGAARQALATELLLHLTEPQNMADWTAQSHVLPTRRDVLAQLGEVDPYLQFAAEELERALPMPLAPNSRTMEVLGNAVFEVLATDRPPAEIAADAVAALRQ